jgi:probable F420-dependent oxidoreductase
MYVDPMGDPPTAASRSFRFGLGPAGLGGGRSSDDWRQLFTRLEDHGYEAVCFGDHIDNRPAPGPAALAAALWTRHLRGAVHVYANDFRHPAVLARELSTIAMLTDGRFDAGIGAGWMAADYANLGLPFDAAADRLERLREAVGIVKATWLEASVSSQGEHYRVTDLAGRTLLGGAPRPRLVMGGGGRRMLTLAAEEADVVSINVRLDAGRLVPERGVNATADATAEKLDVVRAAAGDRFGEIVLQVELHHVEVTADRNAALERASRALDLPMAEIEASPHVLVGSVGEICDVLVERRERWHLSYICMSAAHADGFAPVVRALAGT